MMICVVNKAKCFYFRFFKAVKGFEESWLSVNQRHRSGFKLPGVPRQKLISGKISCRLNVCETISFVVHQGVYCEQCKIYLFTLLCI